MIRTEYCPYCKKVVNVNIILYKYDGIDFVCQECYKTIAIRFTFDIEGIDTIRKHLEEK